MKIVDIKEGGKPLVDRFTGVAVKRPHDASNALVRVFTIVVK